MFGFAFQFPAGRYHATPWGRSVNEASVAWPPEPWRVFRALISSYWAKADRNRRRVSELADLIDLLAGELPAFHLPQGGIHAHTRHYMPIRKGKRESKTLVFDGFAHLPDGAEIQVQWRNTTPDRALLDLAKDLASGLQYFGRAESWTDCRVITADERKPNCFPTASDIHPFDGSAELIESDEWDRCRLLAPRSPDAYQIERDRLLHAARDSIQASSKRTMSETALQEKAAKLFRHKSGGSVLPERLVQALAVETADLQKCKLDQPPAAYEAVYRRDPKTNLRVVGRSVVRRRTNQRPLSRVPTVARYLLAGHPRPRVENAIKIGEVMRAAAMAKFGWTAEDGSDRRLPNAPWQVSGRDDHGRPLRDPTHGHAFWLPEDADDDGLIDHVTVFISSGITKTIQTRLDRVTRIWLGRRGSSHGTTELGADEWRLALEGFGRPEDFGDSSRLLGLSKTWRSATPFLASGHLKTTGYLGEVRRLLRRRGTFEPIVSVEQLETINVAGAPRRPLNFYRFRSRGREQQPDPSGCMLQIEFATAIQGPLALGYASHFGLGAFRAVRSNG